MKPFPCVLEDGGGLRVGNRPAHHFIHRIVEAAHVLWSTYVVRATCLSNQ